MATFDGVVISLVLGGVWFAGFWYFLVLVPAVFLWCGVCLVWCLRLWLPVFWCFASVCDCCGLI